MTLQFFVWSSPMDAPLGRDGRLHLPSTFAWDTDDVAMHSPSTVTPIAPQPELLPGPIWAFVTAQLESARHELNLAALLVGLRGQEAALCGPAPALPLLRDDDAAPLVPGLAQVYHEEWMKLFAGEASRETGWQFI